MVMKKCKMYNVKCKNMNGFKAFIPHSAFYILHSRAKRGQAAVFMLFTLTVLAFLLFWKVDLGTIIYNKERAQNGGDAAALEAARWQASSLNMIGEMNLLHALAAVDENEDACALITDMQVRMCFAGPMIGLLAMQQAAKQNRIHVNEDFTAYIRGHAQTVRDEYGLQVGDFALLEEPWPGAWGEYADMLDAIADDGIAAGPDNHRLYGDFTDPHILADKAFYRAVNAPNWCWFYLFHEGLLENYRGHTYWPPLPAPETPVPEDCEFLGLRVQRFETTLLENFIPTLVEQGEAMGFGPFLPPGAPAWTNVTEAAHTWMYYQPGAWDEWRVIKEDGFPVLGSVKPEFDYEGADIVARVHASSTRVTPNNHRGGNNTPQADEIVWTAASKPFGFLLDNGERRKPTDFGLVLPVFEAARLIPVDTASEGSPGGFDLQFRRHVNEHLPEYLSGGPGALHMDCAYCRSLLVFEDPEFRRRGVDWLRDNSGRCTMPPPNSGGPGGGTQRGH